VKVWHFSTSDIRGGAARAAYRLHDAMRAEGIESRMYVRDMQSDDLDVRPISYKSLRKLSFKEYFRRMSLIFMYGARKRQKGPKTTFNRNMAPEIDLDSFPDASDESPDALILHWISGCLNVNGITSLAERYGCPVLWIATDEEPFTGGCHYTLGCTRYKEMCGSCPQLSSDREYDLSRFTWSEKQTLSRVKKFALIGSTDCLYESIRLSSLFRHSKLAKIPAPLSGGSYRALDRDTARKVLQIPEDKTVIMAGAMSFHMPRKGMDLLKKAFSIVKEKRRAGGKGIEDILLLFVGRINRSWLDDLAMEYKEMGVIQSDTELSLSYQASDLFVCPSLEDVGPMMISQSMLCGTPVVSFRIGIAPELIINDETGYIVDNKNPEDLAEAIIKMIESPSLSLMGDKAEKQASRHHDTGRIINEFKTLIEEISRG